MSAKTNQPSITVKAIKAYPAHDGGKYHGCTVYINGKRAAVFTEDDWGGDNTLRATNDKAYNQAVKAYGDEFEFKVSRLMYDALYAKDVKTKIKNAMKKNAVYLKADCGRGEFYKLAYGNRMRGGVVNFLNSKADVQMIATESNLDEFVNIVATR